MNPSIIIYLNSILSLKDLVFLMSELHDQDNILYARHIASMRATITENLIRTAWRV